MSSVEQDKLLEACEKLADVAWRISTRHHAGMPLNPADWARLHTEEQVARAAIAAARK